MRFASRVRTGVRGAVLAAAVGIAACRGIQAPPGGISDARDVPRRTAGMWVEVLDTTKATVKGELIAVHPDSVFVMQDNYLFGLSRNTIVEARLARYRQHRPLIVGWAVLGMLSTASHGFFLVLSAPIWVGVGIGAAVSESRRAVWHVKDFNVLQPYARFPQGIPPEIDRRQLRDAIR